MEFYFNCVVVSVSVYELNTFLSWLLNPKINVYLVTTLTHTITNQLNSEFLVWSFIVSVTPYKYDIELVEYLLSSYPDEYNLFRYRFTTGMCINQYVPVIMICIRVNR